VAGERGLVPARLKDADFVDERRAAVGLLPFADHLALVRERLGAPRPALVDCPVCGGSVEVWFPAPSTSTRVSCPTCGIIGTASTRLRTV
jgi:hypothetical protein